MKQNFKTCSKCGITKHLCKFHKQAQNLDGFRNECADCIKVYTRQLKATAMEHAKIIQEARSKRINNKMLGHKAESYYTEQELLTGYVAPTYSELTEKEKIFYENYN